MRDDLRNRTRKPKQRKPTFVRAALQTRRQHIKELLVEEALSFGALREQVGGTVRDLDAELSHVQKSLHKPERLVVVAASRCAACDFEFRDRERKHFHAPGRCPECRSTRIFDPVFKIEGVLPKTDASVEGETKLCRRGERVEGETNGGEREDGNGE